MSRTVKSRVRKLEAQQQAGARTHVIWAEDDAERERQVAELKASGKYRDGDEVIAVGWMSDGEA